MGEKRTNGFRTYDMEVMNVLDCVSLQTERLYRKLFQRVNLSKGDGRAFPSWTQMQADCGFSKPMTLSRAIKEAEHFGLISVERPNKADAITKHSHNHYFLTPVSKLPSGSRLEELLTQWYSFKEEQSYKEKERKTKKLLTQGKLATNTVLIATNTGEVGLLTQGKTNKDEVNKDELNIYELNQDEGNFSKKKAVKAKKSSKKDSSVVTVEETAYREAHPDEDNKQEEVYSPDVSTLPTPRSAAPPPTTREVLPFDPSQSFHPVRSQFSGLKDFDKEIKAYNKAVMEWTDWHSSQSMIVQPA
jgi:hypothetical protein